MAASRFEDLAVWQKGHELALVVYGVTADFPRSEDLSSDLSPDYRRLICDTTRLGQGDRIIRRLQAGPTIA
jgi:hypothetical protein